MFGLPEFHSNTCVSGWSAGSPTVSSHPEVLYRLQCTTMILENRQKGRRSLLQSASAICQRCMPTMSSHWLVPDLMDWTIGNGSGSLRPLETNATFCILAVGTCHVPNSPSQSCLACCTTSNVKSLSSCRPKRSLPKDNFALSENIIPSWAILYCLSSLIWTFRQRVSRAYAALRQHQGGFLYEYQGSESKRSGKHA